jgi:NADH:ubiquinone oxidoreductase subunit D
MPISIVLRNEIIKQIYIGLIHHRKENITMTEFYKNLRLESIESLRYSKLVTEMLINNLSIEKITNIQNPKNDIFIILLIDRNNRIRTRIFDFQPEDAVFFRAWLGEDFPDSEFELVNKRHPEVTA